MITFASQSYNPDIYCHTIGGSTSRVQNDDANDKFGRGFGAGYTEWFWNVTHIEMYEAVKVLVSYASFSGRTTKSTDVYVYAGRGRADSVFIAFQNASGDKSIYRYVSTNGITWSSEGFGDAYLKSGISYRVSFLSDFNVLPWIIIDKKRLTFTGAGGGGGAG